MTKKTKPSKRRISSLLLLLSLVAAMCVLSGCNKTVSKEESSSLWTPDAESYAALKEYVANVTDEKSENFIPEADRIAVFDLDGTLYGEKAPYYAIWQTFVERALNDPAYTAPEDVREVANLCASLTQDSSIPSDLEKKEANAEAKAFAGMTLDEYDTFVKNFMQTPASGFENMILADAYYQPMLELVSFLQDNNFTVYICSGTDRFWVRSAIDGVIDIPAEQVIGTDSTIVASGQGDNDGLDYVYNASDTVIRGDKSIIKNVKMNKVSQIVQELGRQPVLAFGNSSGDASMCNYVLDENPYLSMAFMVLADDTEREYGNEEKAAEMRALCEKQGWIPISMKNDWTTIYGEDVTRS